MLGTMAAPEAQQIYFLSLPASGCRLEDKSRVSLRCAQVCSRPLFVSAHAYGEAWSLGERQLICASGLLLTKKKRREREGEVI